MPNEMKLCIQKPDKIENIENNYRCIKRLNNQVLVAVYRKSNEIFTVITAFKTSKLKSIYLSPSNNYLVLPLKS